MTTPVAKHLLSPLSLIAAAALLSACGGGDDKPSTAPAPVPAPSPAPAPAPASTLEQVRALLTAVQNGYASSVPSTGAARTAQFDGCYLHNGYTKKIAADEVDSDPAAFARRLAFQIGMQVTNVAVVAERSVTNPDGSTRKEADITYDLNYRDGTRETVRTTAVSGSTAGLCATPTNSSEWRLLGNRRVVDIGLRARNIRTDFYRLSDGASTGSQLRRDVRFLITDPGKVATYVVVSGPGPKPSGATEFSWKMISPRVLRDDPAFAGKVGRANWRDTDFFQACQASANDTAPTPASQADCVNAGTLFTNWGARLNISSNTTQAQIDNADAAFANLGFVAGGSYTVRVYNDDGWKTVNGQSGKTPIATYTLTLDALPYKFSELGNSGLPLIDNAVTGGAGYPSLNLNSVTNATIAATVKGSAPLAATATLVPAKAPVGQPALGIRTVYTFVSGPDAGATGAWPQTRATANFYPAPGSSTVNLTIPAQPAGVQSVGTAEIGTEYSDRERRRILRIATFQ